MVKLKRYLSAPRRYNRSKGHGIHSPFAFNFVLKVLRERCAYYAYVNIQHRRETAKKMARFTGRHPKMISFKNAKMVFRITNFFNPGTILQIGTNYGVSLTAMLDVSSNSRIVLYQDGAKHEKIYQVVTENYTDRITETESLTEAWSIYKNTIGNSLPFILVNGFIHKDKESTRQIISDALENDGVVIIRNLSRSETVNSTWQEIGREMTHGMSFSNGKLAIMVGYRHLPRQNFSLWF